MKRTYTGICNKAKHKVLTKIGTEWLIEWGLPPKKTGWDTRSQCRLKVVVCGNRTREAQAMTMKTVEDITWLTNCDHRTPL